ncbi:MAG: DUF3303 family protein [Polyangiaceae bacterium]
MLFLVDWKLNENISSEERLRVIRRLTSTGIFPASGVTVVRWDVTPDARGITILEAASAEDVVLAVDTWRAAIPGFFKRTRTSPLVAVADIVPYEEALAQAVKGA